MLFIASGNSLLKRELEVPKRDSIAAAQLITQETKVNVKVKVSKDITNTNTAERCSFFFGFASHWLGYRSEASRAAFNDALSRMIPPAGRAGKKGCK